MIAYDEDELLGDPKPLSVSVEDRLDRHVNGKTPLVEDMHRGVAVGWLAQTFGLSPETVRRKLANCPPIKRKKAGNLYSLPQAAAYLIPPIFDVEEVIKRMKPGDLPPRLQSEYWDASLKRQKFEENARDLWRTSAVLDVFADTFKTIKMTTQLWSEDLERETGLTEEQRVALTRYVDELLDGLHKNLLRAHATRQTLSSYSEVESDLSGIAKDPHVVS